MQDTTCAPLGVTSASSGHAAAGSGVAGSIPHVLTVRRAAAAVIAMAGAGLFAGAGCAGHAGGALPPLPIPGSLHH
jgi:hypothetical protein